MNAFTLPTVQLAFQNEQTSPDKLRGLLAYGPYRPIQTIEPRFGFVFPGQHREYGNRLFLALKNGIGLFRGIENTFRFRFTKEQVFPVHVPGINTGRYKVGSDDARAYADAIGEWQAKQTAGNRPDMFFVIHPKTPDSQLETPYYQCKARLLSQGILSQSVTLELLDNEAQFGWSAANIALGAFVKLGGIPWVVQGSELDKDLIIGLGRAHVFDPISRTNTGHIAFTACFSARGPLRFLSLGQVEGTRSGYLTALKDVVLTSLTKADAAGSDVTSLTLHVPKEMGRDELKVIDSAVKEHIKKSVLQILVVKVTDESSFFAIDDRYQDGVPRRGTAVQVSDSSHMLYTEGRDEKEAWSNRLPSALRVTPQIREELQPEKIRAVLRQINDLSQVNWRGINARAKPISVYYGHLIAKLLSHLPPSLVDDVYKSHSAQALEDRMWFL